MGTPPRRLDVLYLTHNYPRHEGDFAGRFLERLAGLLTERGVRIGVVVPHAPGACEYEVMTGIPVWRFRYADDDAEVLAYRGQAVSPAILGSRGIWAHRRFFSAFRQKARDVQRECSPRVLHAHWWIPGGWIARSIVTTEQLIVTSHGTDLRLLQKKAWMRPLAGHVYRRADVITTVSGWMAETLGSHFPAVRDRIQIAPMPPDDSIFMGQIREETNSLPVILSVTRHTIQKRNLVLIHALSLLRERGLTFRCRLVGDGGTERANLETQIEQSGLGGHVELIPSMSQSELADEYRRADVTVLPAVDEGFGLALVEAQLSGCAVIGARSGGITDIIEDHKSGLLVNPDDPHNLADALQRLLTDHGLRVGLAREGQRSAQTNFSSRAITDRFLQWYQLG